MGKVFLIFRVDDGVFDACFIEHHFCHFAVGAGFRCEQQDFAVVLFEVGIGLHSHVLFAAAGIADDMLVYAVIRRVCDIVSFPLRELLQLAVVPVLYGTIVAGDTAVNFGGLSAFGALEVFARDIAVLFADAVRRRDGVIRQFIVFRDGSDKFCRGFPVGKFFAEERVEYRARSIKRLEFVLHVECREDIRSVSDGKVRAVGVIRDIVVFGSGDDVGELRLIVFCKTIGSGFRRGCFEVVQIAVLFLIIGKSFAHMVEDFFCELLRFDVRQVFSEPFCVEPCLVHADKTDCREVVAERAEITFGVRIKAFFEEFGDDVAFDFQAARGDVHHLVKAAIEVRLIGCEIRDSGKVDGHDADRARAFAAAEEAARFLAKFAKVQAKSATHTSDVRRLHIAVDIVREVRGTVFRGHFKQEFVVFGFRPVEVAGDGIRGDRILETAAVGVALDHDFDKGLIDHIHFFFAILVFEVAFFAADDCVEFRQIVRNRPVKRDVGERSLSTPTAGRVDAVNEGLYALLYFFIRKVIDFDKRRKIRVE